MVLLDCEVQSYRFGVVPDRKQPDQSSASQNHKRRSMHRTFTAEESWAIRNVVLDVLRISKRGRNQRLSCAGQKSQQKWHGKNMEKENYREAPCIHDSFQAISFKLMLAAHHSCSFLKAYAYIIISIHRSCHLWFTRACNIYGIYRWIKFIASWEGNTPGRTLICSLCFTFSSFPSGGGRQDT